MLNKYAAKNIPKIEPNPKIRIYIRPSKGVFSPDCSGNPAVSIGLSNGTRNCNGKQD